MISHLWPDTALVDEEGALTIGGCNVQELCRAGGTPLYILDEVTFRANCRAFVSALAKHYSGPATVSYSGKSLLNTTVARWAYEEGLGIDTVSSGEIHIAMAAGVPARALHMHGNAKPSSELAHAVSVGIGAIVSDTLDEIRQLSVLAERHQTRISVYLRIAPDVSADTHPHIQTGLSRSKFGLSLNFLSEACSLIAESNWLTVRGLHFHLGSQIFDLRAYPDAVDVLLEARVRAGDILGYLPEELSPGGGLAIPYTADDPRTSIREFVKVIATATEEGCRRRGMTLPKLVLEPGRSICGRAVIAAYSVIGRKPLDPEATGGVGSYVHVDGGMADNLRPALYGARYEAFNAAAIHVEPRDRVHLSGRYCESSDILIRDIAMPPCEPGDILVLPNAGAYTLSMASNYNMTLRPALTAVSEGKATIVQRRETVDDLLRRDVNITVPLDPAKVIRQQA